VGDKIQVQDCKWLEVEGIETPHCTRLFTFEGGLLKLSFTDDDLVSVAVPDAPEQPQKKTYTREDVAKVLCVRCRLKDDRFFDTTRNQYVHSTCEGGQELCFATQWLEETRQKGGEK